MSRKRDALDAPGACPAADLLLHEPGEREADQPVEHAARLLGIDEVHVDLAGCGGGRPRHDGAGGFGERRLDRGLGDFVEDDAGDLVVGDSRRFLDVPGDGFAFAVGVCREEDAGGLLGSPGDVR